jgi:hypothetical protein
LPGFWLKTRQNVQKSQLFVDFEGLHLMMGRHHSHPPPELKDDELSFLQ